MYLNTLAGTYLRTDSAKTDSTPFELTRGSASIVRSTKSAHPSDLLEWLSDTSKRGQ